MDKIDKYLNEGKFEKGIVDFLDSKRNKWILALMHTKKSMKIPEDQKYLVEYYSKEKKAWDELVNKIGD